MRRTTVKRLVVFICGLLAAALFMGASSPGRLLAVGPESISLDQAQPVTWGETLTFTGVYTTAEKKDFPPRIYNPVLAVSCNSGSRSAAIQFGHETNLGGGWWQGDFGYIILAGSGPDTCTAFLEFTDSNGTSNVTASSQFLVSGP